MAKIEVLTTQVSETNQDYDVSGNSHFEYAVPEVNDDPNKGELVSAEQCIKLLTEKHGYDEVYKLIRGQLAIVVQAPARKELIEQWHSINVETRVSMITPPTGEVKVVNVTLPEPQRLALQQRMDEFKLGEKAPRTRILRITEDPIDAIARRIKSGDIQGEELDAMRARAMELLGISPTQARRR